MNNTKDLISEAKKLYDNKNFFKAKSYLLSALKNLKLDNLSKLKLYILISDISYKINDFNDSELYLLKYIKIDNSNSKVFNWLGNTYQKKRDFVNSEKFYTKAIDLDKNNQTALVNLAILYHNLGNKKKAVFFYKKVLDNNPNNIGALYNLSNLEKTSVNDETLNKLERLVNEGNLNNFDTASCYFLLAENEKNKKDFKKEIFFLKNANLHSFQEKENKNKQANKYWLKIIPKKFDKIIYPKDKKLSANTKQFYPIFIIGLPRSGSTLIESIISSGKNKVENLGETNLVNWSFLNTNRHILESANNKEKLNINFEITASKLVKSIQNLNIKNEEKIFFSEKSLENFFYIELILNIFPNAKFVHSYRNTIDNIFAIYKQFLSNVSWSHSIEDILEYIDNYINVIKYFKKKYPNKIFSILLEDFTENPKNFSMELFKFCNLEWDEKCLEFHKRNDLFSNTASNNQIRSSVQKYNKKKYEAYNSLLNSYLKKYNWIKF